MDKIINYFRSKPDKLFLLDSIGALLTAFLLFVVLRNYNEFVGMPISVLTTLSIIAFSLSLYSAFCFFFLQKNQKPFIRIIACANLFYCFFTMVFLIVFYAQLTFLGMVYFIAEIMIIIGLAIIELRVSVNMK